MSARSESAAPQRLAVRGETLNVVLRPGRGVPLVICNDFGANLEILSGFAQALNRPTLCFDLPGTGRSANVRRMRRMSGLARLLAEMLDAMDIGSIDLLGIGWGGFLAQRFARDHEPRVRRLVLVATSAGQLMFPGRPASVARLLRPSGLAGAIDAVNDVRRLFGGRRNHECGFVAAALETAQRPTRRGYAAQLYALAGFTSLAWLHQLQIPSLILAGDDDPIVPLVNARMLALLMPQARLSVLPGAGHWLLLERPEEAVRQIEDFLSSSRPIAAFGDPMQP